MMSLCDIYILNSEDKFREIQDWQLHTTKEFDTSNRCTTNRNLWRLSSKASETVAVMGKSTFDLTCWSYPLAWWTSEQAIEIRKSFIEKQRTEGKSLSVYLLSGESPQQDSRAMWSWRMPGTAIGMSCRWSWEHAKLFKFHIVFVFMLIAT